VQGEKRAKKTATHGRAGAASSAPTRNQKQVPACPPRRASGRQASHRSPEAGERVRDDRHTSHRTPKKSPTLTNRAWGTRKGYGVAAIRGIARSEEPPPFAQTALPSFVPSCVRAGRVNRTVHPAERQSGVEPPHSKRKARRFGSRRGRSGIRRGRRVCRLGRPWIACASTRRARRCARRIRLRRADRTISLSAPSGKFRRWR